MFEFKTAIHAIPTSQLYLYYLVLFLLYVFFLRNVKITMLTGIIMLLFNQGFLISLLRTSGSQFSKFLFVVLITIFLFAAKFKGFTRVDTRILLHTCLFAFLFFLNYIYNEVNLLWASFQYYKYFVPIALFFAIRGWDLDFTQSTYYGKLVIKLIAFQVVFSIVKLIIIGFRENITGSIANVGGGVGVGYAIMGLILFWVMRGRKISGRDWWYVASLLLIPVASNKRAIWFLYPAIIFLLITNRITKQTLQKIILVLALIPMIVYVGFRFNPSLNPEKKIWGSFNLGYALDYALSYSGASEEKLQSDYASGRWGATLVILDNTLSNPLSSDALIGYARSREGKLSEDFIPQDYGLRPGTMISSLGIMLLQLGWPATLLAILIFAQMIYTIPDKKIARIIALYVMFDVVFYSGSMINSPVQSLLLVICIWIIKGYTEGQERISTQQGSLANTCRVAHSL